MPGLYCLTTCIAYGRFPKATKTSPLDGGQLKTHFVKAIPKVERRSIIRIKRGERAIWQRRYWEHFIRDDNDYQRNIDYLHYNPVKHGYVSRRVWLASFDFSSISGTRDLPRKLGHWECWWIRRRWVWFSLEAEYAALFRPTVYGLSAPIIRRTRNNAAYSAFHTRLHFENITASVRAFKWIGGLMTYFCSCCIPLFLLK